MQFTTAGNANSVQLLLVQVIMVEQLHGTALSDISLFSLCMCVSRFQGVVGAVGAATVVDSGGHCAEVNSTDVDSVVVSLVYSHELCTEICPSLCTGHQGAHYGANCR